MVDIAAAAALTVTIYQNGDPNFYGKRFVVNRRRVRTLDAFLDNVTVDIKSSKAVRRLCTPLGTHEVRSLETLENGGKYVAITSIGRNGFKKLNYGELGVAKTSPRGRKPKGGQFRHKLAVAGRARQEYEWEKLALKIIKVYRNGDEFQPGTRILLKRKVLQDMELVLSTCQDHMVLTSAIAALYTTNGELVQDTKSLENGGMYVAVERRRPFFQRANYGDQGHVPRGNGPVRLPPIGNGQMTTATKVKQPSKTKSVSPSKSKNTSTTPRAIEANLHLNPPISSRDLTPDLANERAKISSEFESEADFRPSVSPPLHLDDTPISDISKRTQAKASVAHEAGPSIFEASGQQSEKAKAVRETTDTAVEKPVDLLPAEEVVEDLEKEAGNDVEKRESRSGSPAKRNDESDSEVESIPDATHSSHVVTEEPSQNASGDEEQQINKNGQGKGSRGSSSHSRRASSVERENSPDEMENGEAVSSSGSPPTERKQSRKSLHEEDDRDTTSVGDSAGNGPRKENEGSAENVRDNVKGDANPNNKTEREGNEDENQSEENPTTNDDDNNEENQDTPAQ